MKTVEGSSGDKLHTATAMALMELRGSLISRFKRTYAGRSGCACGCRGTYSEAQGTATRRYRSMLKLLTEGNNLDWVCVSYDQYDMLEFIAVDTASGRAITLYTKTA